MRTKMGLSEEAAKKIIKGVQNQRMIGSLQQAKSAGQLTLGRLLDMRESGIDIESFVNEDMRLQMWCAALRRVQRTWHTCHRLVPQAVPAAIAAERSRRFAFGSSIFVSSKDTVIWLPACRRSRSG